MSHSVAASETRSNSLTNVSYTNVIASPHRLVHRVFLQQPASICTEATKCCSSWFSGSRHGWRLLPDCMVQVTGIACVSEQVKSQTVHRPLAHGMTVFPSGLLPSSLDREIQSISNKANLFITCKRGSAIAQCFMDDLHAFL